MRDTQTGLDHFPTATGSIPQCPVTGLLVGDAEQHQEFLDSLEAAGVVLPAPLAPEQDR